MASSRLNQAVTKDGETYNKLVRPKDYLTSTTPCLPPLPTVSPSNAQTHKRKHGRDVALGSKRFKADGSYSKAIDGQGRSRALNTSTDFGMRTMLPGGNDDEQLLDGSMSEAIAYLRSVRSEASTIPPLLVAEISGESGDDNDETLPRSATTNRPPAVYHDGIWIAIDDGHESTAASGSDCYEHPLTFKAQQSYHEMLVRRFLSLRNTLSKANTQGSDQVDVGGGASNHLRYPTNKRAWLDVIDSEFPISDRISSLSSSARFLALQSCAASLSRSATVGRKKSCWIWALLALTDDVGTLDHERIGKVRELGLQAGRLGARLREEFTSDHTEDNDEIRGEKYEGKIVVSIKEVDQKHSKHSLSVDLKVKTQSNVADHSGSVEAELYRACEHQRHSEAVKDQTSESDTPMSMSGDEENQDLKQARARLLAQLGDRLVQTGGLPLEATSSVPQPPSTSSSQELVDTTVDWNTRITIDMVLTVVAECYGQKDLLKYREAW